MCVPWYVAEDGLRSLRRISTAAESGLQYFEATSSWYYCSSICQIGGCVHPCLDLSCIALATPGPVQPCEEGRSGRLPHISLRLPRDAFTWELQSF